MLLALRKFIEHHQVVSTEQLSREFHIADEALEPILAIWMRKGLIEKANKDHCGAACRSCQPKGAVYYRFLKNNAQK